MKKTMVQGHLQRLYTDSYVSTVSVCGFLFNDHCFGLSEELQQASKSVRLGKYFDNVVRLIFLERKNKEDFHFSHNFTGALNQNATGNQIAD